MSTDTSVAPGSDAEYGEIAEAIHRGHLTGRLDISPALHGLTREEGLAVQLAVLARMQKTGEELGGWKVGMTSGGSLNKMGEGFRPFGFILKSRIFASGASVSLDGAGPADIEPELAFRILRPLRGTELTPADVRTAISGAIPSFELLALRLQGKGSHGATIADDLMQWGLVLGEASHWLGDVADIKVDLRRDGALLVEAGPRFAIDDPFQSIATLCAMLAPFGLGLEPGQHVITGAFHRAGLTSGTWTSEFKGVGAVTITAR